MTTIDERTPTASPRRAHDLLRAREPLAVAGGVLVALSLPPWGFWPLAFVGIALFEVALGERPGGARAARLGFLFGLPWMAIGMWWMWFLTVPGYLVAATLFGGLHAIAAAVAPAGRWRVLGRPAAQAFLGLLRDPAVRAELGRRGFRLSPDGPSPAGSTG